MKNTKYNSELDDLLKEVSGKSTDGSAQFLKLPVAKQKRDELKIKCSSQNFKMVPMISTSCAAP